MPLSNSDVEHVAMLARLGLTSDEIDLLREQLSSILEHVDVLSRVDTDAIPPTAQVNDLHNVLREDIVRPSLTQEAVLANAPASRNGFFEVRAVLSSDDGENG